MISWPLREKTLWDEGGWDARKPAVWACCTHGPGSGGFVSRGAGARHPRPRPRQVPCPRLLPASLVGSGGSRCSPPPDGGSLPPGPLPTWPRRIPRLPAKNTDVALKLLGGPPGRQLPGSSEATRC